MLGIEYAQKIMEQIKLVQETQWEAIAKAAQVIAASLKEDRLLHLFGCGHSHLMVEEVFYRAGGIVPINPIFETSTMLHEGAVKSSQIERMQGYAEHILNNYTIQAGEVIIIISNSGLNSLPVEMAMEAKNRGLKVIALTSSSYFHDTPRHPSGKKLYELADIILDNKLPHGDALVQIPQSEIKMAPGSTVIGAFILNTLMTEVVEELIHLNVEPPVFLSGNVAGGFEYNQKYIELYRQRVKHL